MVTSSIDGKLRPFRAIFKGKTDASLPRTEVRELAANMGMKFEPGGHKHWATVDTTKRVSATLMTCD
jgi:hypothetical protein